MESKFLEVTNGENNWGKFLLARFTHAEWKYRSMVDTERPLLRAIGWGDQPWFVMDLQTGEGALFRPGGMAAADLNKHRVWVCPLFEPMLEWLYASVRTNGLDEAWASLPNRLDLPEAPFEMAGYRRPGPEAE